MVRHGFGYFLEAHKLDRPAAGALCRGAARRDLRRRNVGARPASARAPRRARPDLREVRAAALDASRRRAAGHHHGAARPPGRRAAVPVRAGRARDRGRPRQLDRAPLPRLRSDACRSGVDRAGASRDAPERQARRGQDPASGRAAADRGRPRAALPGGETREGARARARLHRRARARRRVRTADPPGARLPARGPERADVPPQLRGQPARARAEGLLDVHARARADARVARRGRSSPTSTRCRSRSRSAATSRTGWPRRGWR